MVWQIFFGSSLTDGITNACTISISTTQLHIRVLLCAVAALALQCHSNHVGNRIIGFSPAPDAAAGYHSFTNEQFDCLSETTVSTTTCYLWRSCAEHAAISNMLDWHADF